MKVLFVCSGNQQDISPIIKNQADSLVREGVIVDYYPIVGKGISGYLNNVQPLRRYIKNNNIDIIHAHYSLTAFVASLAMAKPLVVSLMGSDVKASSFYKLIIKVFAFLFSWKEIIVKSQDMYDDLGIKRAKIIPNGVDCNRFKPLDKSECQNILNWNNSKQHILFPANPKRKEKNYQLALKTIELLNDENVELHFIEKVPNEDMPIWYNAADVVFMTSLWEGSPNAIKESLACCRPIVATNVGDISYLLCGVDGTLVETFDTIALKNSLQLAMQFNTINGIEQIDKLEINSQTIACKLIKIYDRINK